MFTCIINTTWQCYIFASNNDIYFNGRRRGESLLHLPNIYQSDTALSFLRIWVSMGAFLVDLLAIDSLYFIVPGNFFISLSYLRNIFSGYRILCSSLILCLWSMVFFVFILLGLRFGWASWSYKFVSHQIWEIFGLYFFRYLLCPIVFYLPSPSRTPNDMYVKPFDIVP